MPTENHKLYFQALRDKHMYPTVAYGSAGTGKTFGAVEAAYEALVNKRVERIICTRPNIPFAKESGHLPGTEREKLLPWIRPILQHFSNFANERLIEDWEKRGKLVFYPLESIQGLTFDNSFVILDECQNLTFKQLMVFMQRTGEYSKIVMCGDIAQVSPMFKGSGLAEFLDMVEHFDLPVHRIHFTRDDIVRSGICKQFVVAEEEWELYINS